MRHTILVEVVQVQPVIISMPRLSKWHTSWVWWHTPVIPAVQEAETGGSLSQSRPTTGLTQNSLSALLLRYISNNQDDQPMLLFLVDTFNAHFFF